MMHFTMSDYLLSFAEELRSARKGLCLSRDELAEMAGLHPNTIAVAERGNRDLNTITQTRIFAALGCREIGLNDGCLYLLTGNEPSPREDLLHLNDPFIIRCIGDTIRQKRAELGLTLEEMSVMTGMHVNSLWNCEHGLVIPQGNTLVRIYQSLGITTLGACSRGLDLG